MRAGSLPVDGGRPSLFVQARRDPAAFADLYAAYYEQVLRYLAGQTLDRDVAFDLMAETFAEMFAAIGAFRGSTEGQGRQWMWTIARHQLYRWRERGRVERDHLVRLGIELRELAPEEYERIEELADLERYRPVLAEALATLSPAQRHVLQLRIVEHRAHGEIAELLGASAGAVRIRVSRALRELAQALAVQEAAR